MPAQLQQEHATSARPDSVPAQTVGHVVVEALIARGVDTLFGLPGIQIDPLFSALYDYRGRIRVVDSRHEQGAAYMAFGFAEASSRPGVFAVVPGPGMLNASAALATAYACGSSVLGLIGHMSIERIGANAGDLHDIPDQTGIVTRLVRHHRRIEKAEQAGVAVGDLLGEFDLAGRGPAALELPAGLLAVPSIAFSPAPAQARLGTTEISVDTVAHLLDQSISPLVFVGRGAVHAASELRSLAAKLGGVPVVAQGRGKGILPDAHGLAMPLHAAASLWDDADVVVAIGTRMRHALQAWSRPAGQTLIVIDHDRTSGPAATHADHFIEGDAKTVLAELLSHSAIGERNEHRNRWCVRAEAAKRATFEILEDKLAPQMRWLGAIRSGLPEDGLVVTDYTRSAMSPTLRYL